MKVLVLFAAFMQSPYYDLPKEVIESHEEQNKLRAAYGYPSLTLDRELCRRAQRHAEWMAYTGRYEHSGESMEIIYKGPTSAKDAFHGYHYSPAHFGIILSGSRTGHGHATGYGIHYWVTLNK